MQRKRPPTFLLMAFINAGNDLLSHTLSRAVQSAQWGSATLSPMPTVLRSGPYRFYFYSHEPNEPPHIHVDRDERSAKFWLKKVSLADNVGFAKKELNELHEIISKHQKKFLDEWNAYFSS